MFGKQPQGESQNLDDIAKQKQLQEKGMQYDRLCLKVKQIFIEEKLKVIEAVAFMSSFSQELSSECLKNSDVKKLDE